jgi:SAM-dependent methyltransferase
MNSKALFTLHSNLPREGPGSDRTTVEAILRLHSLPPSPVILDIGCGSGQQTLVLVQELKAPVIAVDIHQPYLLRLQEKAAALGLEDMVKTCCADMGCLPVSPNSIDLIWAEGSIFILGFDRGLSLWHPLLSDKGLLVVSECTWLSENPPTEALAFWQQAYPPMTTIEKNMAIASDIGFKVFDYFILPQSAWWDEYYLPLQKQITELRVQNHQDSELNLVLDEAEQEIEIWTKYGDSYGYVFYLMQKKL